MKNDGPFLLEIRRIAPEDASSDAYNALYAETSLAQIPSFYLWLFERLRLPAGGTLLDVSCGSGQVVRLAAARGLTAVGIDISETAAQQARLNTLPKGGITVGAGEQLPFSDDSFDVVTNIGSLEHFANPAQGVREMARVLRPGGQAFVLVPNTFSLLSNILVAWRTGATAADHQPIQRYGARADWTRLLEANGLEVRRTTKYDRPFPRVAADWSYYIRRPKEVVRLLISPFVPLNLAFCFLFTCARAESHSILI